MVVVAAQSRPGGGNILIEINDPPDADRYYDDVDTREQLSERLRERARTLFIESLDLLDECSTAVADRFTDRGENGPAEVELKLAVQLDAKAGAKIVELGGSAHMEVVLRWRANADA